MIVTGETTTVRDFVMMAFKYVGIRLEFKGIGVDEKAYVVLCNNPDYQVKIRKEIISVDHQYFRLTEVDLLLGGPTKAETKLGWKREYKLKEFVDDMMQSDLKLMSKDVYLQDGGYKTMNYFE
jgi:GDPmannose 4,6-dehydratase